MRVLIRKEMNGFYSEEELQSLGLKKFGKNVKISRDARILNPQSFVCGDNVRIDALTFLTGEISLGSYIHISPFCILQGSGGGIFMENFSALSGGVKVYTSDADYSLGQSLTNPTIPKDLKKSTNGPVRIGEHVLIGANSVVLPTTILHQGAVFGALSLIKGEQEGWKLYGGVPAKTIRERPKEVILSDAKKLIK